MTGQTPSTRKKVLLLIRRHGPMTVQELGRKLGISVSGVRQHTAVLEQASLIRSRPRKRKVGRPGHEYLLSPESEDAFPKLYKDLALALLTAAEEIGGEKLVQQLVVHWRTRIYREYAKKLRGASDQEKLPRIAESQDARGHLAHFEQNGRVQRLIHYNCVVQELSALHPEFCESERRMYQKLLGRPVKLEQCRARGAEYCCFSTRLKTPKKHKKR